jgi:hypothetical protein
MTLLSVIVLNNNVTNVMAPLTPQTKVPFSCSSFTMMVWFITTGMAVSRMIVIRMTISRMTVIRMTINRMKVTRMTVSRMTIIPLNNLVIILLPQTEVPFSNSSFTTMVWFITARMAIRRMTVFKMTFGRMTIFRKAPCRMTLSMMGQYNESAK